MRLEYNDTPISMTKPDGTFYTLADINLKNQDVLEITHRHGKLCRFCKRWIKIKFRERNGVSCSYHVNKRLDFKTIIDGFSQFSCSSIENMKFKYEGKEFNLIQPDGTLTTPADLQMGDGDQIDIVHERNIR